MISFDLFKKDDLSLLLNSFDTDFLQMPMKRPSKSLLEFIPNGFRPEKLARFQLDKVYVNALYSRESSASDYLLNELLRNFEEYGIDEYMKDKIGSEYQVSKQIIEIATITYEAGMVIPAHTILMLYGVQCSEEEKQLSTNLHSVVHSKRDEGEKNAFEDGFAQGEKKMESELESERKKVAKLQKNLDNAAAKQKDNQQNSDAQQIEMQKLTLDNQSLSAELDEKIKRIEELEPALESLMEDIASLSTINENQKETIDSLSSELNSIKSELTAQKTSLPNEPVVTKVELSSDELRDICLDAINLFTGDNSNRDKILALAKEKITDSEDVKESWLKLCADSSVIIDELYTLMLQNTFDMQLFEKFAEIEGILLLESAIQQSLCSLAHKIMASTDKDPMNNKFFVND